MSDQLDLFAPTWRDLPTGPFKLPYYQCPGCKKHPNGSSSGPTYEDGVLVGFTARNECCGFSWFRPATPEQVENSKSWGDR